MSLNIFSLPLMKGQNKLECLFLAGFSSVRLLKGASVWHAPALHAKIRLDWKGLQVQML
jgi:hypothetical protein